MRPKEIKSPILQVMWKITDFNFLMTSQHITFAFLIVVSYGVNTLNCMSSITFKAFLLNASFFSPHFQWENAPCF